MNMGKLHIYYFHKVILCFKQYGTVTLDIILTNLNSSGKEDYPFRFLHYYCILPIFTSREGGAVSQPIYPYFYVYGSIYNLDHTCYLRYEA